MDEITQHEEEVMKILRTSVRTTNKEFAKEAQPSMLLTGNPGGIGHGWVKRIFIDKNLRPEENKNHFDFVQAKVYDNEALMDADPNYLQTLMDLPEDKRRAYLEGDWDVFEGAVFQEFRRDKHVMEQFVPKPFYRRYLGIDWGYSGRKEHKGAFAAYAMVHVEERTKMGDSFNRVIVYNEWYGRGKTPEEWADIIRSETEYSGGIADPSMFNPTSDGSIAIAKRMMNRWNKKEWYLSLKQGTRNRQTRIQALHDWLKDAPDGLPYLIVTDNCKNLIRTLPILIYDPHNPEDVESKIQEDHPFDALTYMLAAIKYTAAHLGSVDHEKTFLERKYMPLPLMELNLEKFENAKLARGRWQRH